MIAPRSPPDRRRETHCKDLKIEHQSGRQIFTPGGTEAAHEAEADSDRSSTHQQSNVGLVIGKKGLILRRQSLRFRQWIFERLGWLSVTDSELPVQSYEI